jgi:rubrerythrin
MSFKFNVEEIFEMAVKMEQEGAQFYRTAAGHCDDVAIREVLLDLAEMEDGHQQMFRDLKNMLTAADAVPTAYDPEDQTVQYLTAMVEHSVFKENASFNPKDLQQVFERALQAEKDSIAFYNGLKNLVTGDFGKERVDAIIHEEMNHVSMIAGLLNRLRDQ